MRRLTFLLVCSLTLAGCGETPTQLDGRTATRTIVSVPGVDYGELARNHLGGSIVDEGRGGDLLRRARTVMQTAPGFEAEFVARAFGRFRGGKDTGTAREISNRYKVVWARPGQMKADVTEASEGDLEGARIATAQGGGFVVKAPGLLGLFPRKVPADDPRLKNARGHALAAVSPDAQVARLSADQAVWTVIGEGRTPQGEPTVRIGVQNVQRLDGEIDREELELETQSLAIYQYAAYVGMRRVLGYDFVAFRWTTPPAASFAI